MPRHPQERSNERARSGAITHVSIPGSVFNTGGLSMGTELSRHHHHGKRVKNFSSGGRVAYLQHKEEALYPTGGPLACEAGRSPQGCGWKCVKPHLFGDLCRLTSMFGHAR